MNGHCKDEGKGEATECFGPLKNEATAAEVGLSGSLLPSSGVIVHITKYNNTMAH